MGFNWRLMLAWFFCIATADLGGPQLGLSRQQQSLFDGLLVLVFIVLTLLFSRVARHNLLQMRHADAHQWVGDGEVCEECVAPDPSLGPSLATSLDLINTQT